MKWRLVSAVCLGVGVAPCAAILGLDDGTPRTSDAAVDAPFDAAADARDAGNDAASDAPFSPLSCGNTDCNLAIGEACCRTGATSYQCVTSKAACAGTYIPCDRPSQCPATDAGAQTCCTTGLPPSASNVPPSGSPI